MNEVPSDLHAFSHLVLTTLCLGGKYYHNPHFINKKIKAERGRTMCPKSERGWELMAMNLNKASLVLELTHLRRKISKRLLHGHNIGTYSYWLQDKALEPKNRSYWKNWLIIWKMYNNSFRCLTQILSRAFPHHFKSNWPFPWMRAIILIAKSFLFSVYKSAQFRFLRWYVSLGHISMSLYIPVPTNYCTDLSNLSIKDVWLWLYKIY